MNYKLSKHAHCRMDQRGLTLEAIQLVVECGTPTRDGILMTQGDIRREISISKGLIGFDKQKNQNMMRSQKHRIERLQKLPNVFVVIDGGNVLTVQRARSWKVKRELHNLQTRKSRRAANA